jgi:anti-sigma factor RsiW
MSGSRPIEDAELHAYVDSALDPERMRAVEGQLKQDPALAARVAGYREDKLALKNLYGTADAEPLPPAWATMIETRKRLAPSRRVMGVIAAALLIAVSGTGLYLRMSSRPAETGLVASALSARNEANPPLQILPPSADAHRYDAALQAVVGSNVRVPVLDRLGYRFSGMRTYQGAAELLYRNGEGRLFSLYLRRSEGQVRFDQFERGGLRICIWQDDRISMVMAGNVSAAVMQRLASLAYTGLSA